MDFSFIASYVVVAFAAAALIYAALSDLKNFTIRNSLVLLLAFLYVVHAALTRLDGPKFPVISNWPP